MCLWQGVNSNFAATTYNSSHKSTASQDNDAGTYFLKLIDETPLYNTRNSVIGVFSGWFGVIKALTILL